MHEHAAPALAQDGALPDSARRAPQCEAVCCRRQLRCGRAQPSEPTAVPATTQRKRRSHPSGGGDDDESYHQLQIQASTQRIGREIRRQTSRRATRQRGLGRRTTWQRGLGRRTTWQRGLSQRTTWQRAVASVSGGGTSGRACASGCLGTARLALEAPRFAPQPAAATPVVLRPLLRPR